jgi:hypothetical protein
MILNVSLIVLTLMAENKCVHLAVGNWKMFCCKGSQAKDAYILFVLYINIMSTIMFAFLYFYKILQITKCSFSLKFPW